MPAIIADINGFQTPIEINASGLSALSPLKVSGNAESYTIDYGGGLVEVGGVVTFTTDTVEGEYREGYGEVTLPFTPIDAQVSAWNISDTPQNARRENAFLRTDGKKLVIYGWFLGSSHREMRVKWSAKGIKE